jgi:hypothetical protein
MAPLNRLRGQLTPKFPGLMQPVGGKADPASAGKYLAQWERRFVLDHDLKALVRPVKPDDHRLIHDLFAHMSRSDLRLRFFDSMKEISPKLMRRLTQFDYSRAIAFIMIDQSNGRALGVVRLHGDEGRESAEFAIAVRSDLKGRGLGWLMMQLKIGWFPADLRSDSSGKHGHAEDVQAIGL